VRVGDRALIVSSLTAEALADLGPDEPSVPVERLQATIASFTGYVSEGNVGPYWSVRALRKGQRPKWIFLRQIVNGEWKIGAF
jgi:hypothetical protein